MENQPKQMISGLWIGEELPLLSELCIRSFLDNGIAFQLFTYREYENIPEGTIVRHGSEIVPEDEVFYHANGSLAPFADLFRNRFLVEEGGFWTDLDMMCLKPELPSELPWFAQQEPGLVAVGIIGFPPHHPVMENFNALSDDPATPMPWDNDYEISAKKQFAIDTPDKMLRRRRAAWGTSGPEGFTSALAHYKLLDKAAPFSSIYPLHYTVWRFCYDGTRNLQSEDIQNSWAIHMWGELLRREPDAFENYSRYGIVGQLIEKHMPSRQKEPCKAAEPVQKEPVDILVGICSCTTDWARTRRDAVRETWLEHSAPGITCKFFVGNNHVSQDEAADTIALDVNDSYNFLPLKVMEFFRHALKHYDFKWVFKCDDDTYLALDRLKELAKPEYDMIGDLSISDRGAPSGGAGYFLSRDMVEQIVNHPSVPQTGAEDIIIGKIAMELGARAFADKRLNGFNQSFPMSDNDAVTSHWCSPDYLRAIEFFFHSQPISEYEGTHPYWKDKILFYENGYFRRASTGCCGKYELTDQGMTLKWFSWGEEALDLHEGSYSNQDLQLNRLPGQPGIEDIEP